MNGTVHLDASETTDNPSDIGTLEYIWYMGDGKTRTGRNIEYTYSSPGSYEIILTVMDDDGGSSEFTMNVLIGTIEDTEPRIENEGNGSLLPVIMVVVVCSIIIFILALVLILYATGRLSGKEKDPLLIQNPSVMRKGSMEQRRRIQPGPGSRPQLSGPAQVPVDPYNNVKDQQEPGKERNL